MTPPLPIVVIGAGHLGRIHARLLKSNPDVSLVGVVDPVVTARDSVAREFDIKSYADVGEVSENFVGAIVATPTQFHYSVAMPLLTQGVHLLIEKPITLNVAEADALIDTAHAHEVVLQVGHVERFNPAFVALRHELHEPRFIESVRAGVYSFRSTDVGVVLDLMIHDLDLVLSLVKSEVVSVEAMGAVVLGPHEDIAHARLRFANGSMVNLSASRTNFQPQRSMRFFSDRLFASIDFVAGTAQVVRPDERVLRREIDIAHLSADEKNHIKDHFYGEILHREEVQVEKSNAILEEQRDFLGAIQEKRSPLVTGEAGRQALAVAEEILRQIHTPQFTATVPSRPRIAA